MSEFYELLNNYVKEKGFSDQDLANMVEKHAKKNNIELNCGKNSGINREMFHYWRTKLQSPKNENCNVVHILVKIFELNAEDGQKLLDLARCGKIDSPPTTKPCVLKPPLEKVYKFFT